GEGRLIIWGVAVENWINSGRLFFGNGTFSFASFFNMDNYDSAENAWIGNLYITLLHDYGLVGFITFGAFVISLVKRGRFLKISLPKSEKLYLLRGTNIGIMTTLIAFFFTTGLSLSFCWLLFGLAVGLKGYLSKSTKLLITS